MGEELKESIENQKLNAGACKNLFARKLRKNLVHHSLRSPVAVADWLFNKIAACIYQPIVDAPTIDPEAADGPAELSGSLTSIAKAAFDLGKDLRQIPTQMTARFARRVPKPAHFFQQQLPGRYSRQTDAAAAGSEINCDIKFAGHE
jgi:hypothetical protein